MPMFRNLLSVPSSWAGERSMSVVGLCGVYIRLMVKGVGVAEPMGSTVLCGAVRLPVGSGGGGGKVIYMCVVRGTSILYLVAVSSLSVYEVMVFMIC